MILLLPAVGGLVFIYLYHKHRIAGRIFVLLLCAETLAAGLLVRDFLSGGRKTVSSLSLTGQEEGEEIPLEVETKEGNVHEVTIRIPEKTYTAGEAETLLQKKAASLDTQILGKNKSFQKIEWDMDLPVCFTDPPIRAEWTTDRPDILSGSGVIGNEADPGGTRVSLKAELYLQDTSISFERILTVYPSKEEKTLEQRLQIKSEELNAGKTSLKYQLPEELDGQRLTWYEKKEKGGEYLAVLILLAGILTAVSAGQKETQKEKKRQEELQRSYPGLVSKIQLFLGAGLSMRKVFERLSSDYKKEYQRTGKKKAAYEEISRSWFEMERGVLEQDAYHHLGERCCLPSYKGLALLLEQNQKKGGQRLIELLETEVQQAFAERRRKAKEEGEKAAVRMAVPMIMMLVVVLAILMIPAMLSF